MTAALLDAGLLPLHADRPADADPIATRSYRHPQLGDRPVIRLVGQAVAPAEDAAMAFFGFEPPSVGQALAAGRRRALGYPAWALVHDPDNAAAALAVVDGLEKTARLTASRPGFAAEEYSQLAAKLPDSHLPAFWEQAGRAYIAAGNTGQAAQAFARARSVELTRNLPVDEEVRREVYLEFAAGGGLTIKAITEYLDDLRRRYPPERAYAEFVRLAERRTSGGFAPWAALPKQARSLAKAAGLDVAAEEGRLLTDLLRMPATRHAPAGFWTATRAPLVRLAKRDPGVRRRLLDLFPTAPDDDWWIDLLDSVQAFDLLLKSEPGVPATWMTQLARRRARHDYPTPPPAPKAYALVPRLAARLQADGRSVNVSLPRKRGPWHVDVDLLDACLAAGVPIVPPPAECTWIYLDRWHENGTRDLAAVADDPVCSPLLRNGLSYLLSARNQRHDRLLSMPSLTPMVEEILGEWIATARSGGVLAARHSLELLDQALSRELPAGLADLTRGFNEVDVAAILARTLRAGVFAEYGWEALDEASRRLGDPGRLRCSASWPVLTIWNKTQAIAVGPDGPVAEHDLRIPAGHEITTVLYSGGQFLVVHTAGLFRGWTGYWSGRPNRTFALDLPYALDDSHGVLTGDGERLNGRQVLRPGDQVVQQDRPVLTDGNSYWTTRDGQQHKLYELDPETCTIGRAALPPAFEAVVGSGRAVFAEACWLRRLPDGSVAGFLAGEGWIATADDRVIDGVPGNVFSHRPRALVRFPGSQVEGVLRGYSDLAFTTLDDAGDHWEVSPGSAAPGLPFVPPVTYWPLLQPRDPAGSKVLRDSSEQTAAELLAAVKSTSDNAMTDAVGRVLPEVTHPQLRLGIAGLVREAIRLSAFKERLLARKPAAVAKAEPTSEADVLAGLHGLLAAAPTYSYRHGQPLAELTMVSEILAGGELPVSGPPASSGQWLALIGGAAVVAIRAATPFGLPSVRAALLDLLETWAASPFVRDDVELIVGELAQRSGPVLFRDGNGVCVTVGDSKQIAGIRYAGTNPRIGVPVARLEVQARGWGSREQIGAFVQQVKAAGPMPWSPAAADVLAAGSGISRAAARIMLAGLPGIKSHEQNFLDKDVRTGLQLKVPEAVAARDELRLLPRHELIALYGKAMPGDPAELWTEPGQLRYAERLAEAYTARFGRGISIDSETIVAARTLGAVVPAAQLLGAVAAPGASKELNHDGLPLDAWIFDLAALIPWAYAYLPAGDPVRSGIPQALELIRQRLANPKLLVRAGTLQPFDDIQGQVARILGEPAGNDWVVVSYNRWAPDVHFRPASLPQGDFDETELARLFLAAGLERYGLPNAILLLRGLGYSAMAERIQDAVLPAGSYEADPAASVPELLADVRQKLALEADPARLYLQLLALLEPTDRNVRQWNGWTPARHKQAAAVLVEHGLVVEDRRARAGRSVFLPGAWIDAKAPNVPVERFKVELNQLCLHDDGHLHGWLPRWLPYRPLPELFEAAWQKAQVKDL